MRRKKPFTLNLPPRLKALATAYAEANDLSLSSLIEDLLRDKLEAEGIKVGLPIEELIQQMAGRFGLTVRPSGKKAALGE